MEILPWLSVGVCLLLGVLCLALYLDGRGARKALDVWRASTDRALTDHGARLTGHNARIDTLERAILPPPPAPPAAPPPPVSFPPTPGGLPLRPVSLTRDDDPAHTRATVVAPPPKDAPPSTVPSRSRTVRSGERDDTEARALDRLAAMDAELGPEGKADVRARIEAAEDERERARSRGELGQLPRMDDDDGRETFDDATKVMDIGAARDAVAKATGGAPVPPPHRPPVPLKSTRPTMVGAPPAPPREPAPEREPSWVEKRVAHLADLARQAGERFDPAAARRQAEREGQIAGAAPGRRDRDTLTPTEPSAPSLDARIERLWHHKIAAAIEAGKDARHCHGERCFHETHSVSACECHCDGCAMVTDLLTDATREVMGKGRR